ncbi:uncharacterized protein LOC141706059 isoform X1 [Apium graveolens]|uniref:uncharacterized protein LOC141706059 isoform X1 n=1 Tax=Apium graveolens TaxID=4045 RepID=UPI003D7A95C4
MNHVPRRKEKRVITTNKKSQPVSTDDKLVSEFNHFLGKIVRNYVSLTCVSWSKVPNKDILWEYVKEKAKKNRKARSKVEDTHTTGPRSFAQIRNKMELAREVDPENPDEDLLVDPEDLDKEPSAPISDAHIFVETHKRNPKREYKVPTEAVMKKIDDIGKILKTGGNVKAANKLVYGSKEHDPSFLVGRVSLKKEVKEKAATSTTVQND